MTDASIILSGNKPINHSRSIAEAMGLVQNAIDAPNQSKMLGEQVRSAGLQNDYQAMVNKRAPTMLDQQMEQGRIANATGNLSLEAQQQLQYLRNAAPDAYQMSQLIDAGQPDRARALLAKRIKMLQEQGRDSSDSEAIMQQMDAGNIDGVRSELQSVVDTSVRAGVFGQDNKGLPSTLQEWNAYQAMSPQDQKRYLEMKRGADPFELANYRSNLSVGEYGQKRDIEAQTAPVIAQGSTMGKKQEERDQSIIDRGVSAAESTANIKRAITLLDSVGTGGFDSAALRAKQMFGIESADEGELSNSLGKSVLSQLRETFGAAFTQEEGARLERIEASFSKSPATNKRLLEQALRIANRTASRALNLAEQKGDTQTADDIRELLNFSLDDPGSSPSSGNQQQGGTFTTSSGIKFTVE